MINGELIVDNFAGGVGASTFDDERRKYRAVEICIERRR